MENNKKAVWIGIEDKENSKDYQEMVSKEFNGVSISDALAEHGDKSMFASNRRDFLKFLGFGLGAATIAAGCDAPVRKAIPYVVKPDTIVPGVASYYASSFVQGGDYCSVLVKTREGRPIKIEGNSLSKITRGGTNARAQASVLSLYDYNRFPSAGSITDGKFQAISWDELDKAVAEKLNTGSKVRIVAPTIMSPTTKKAIQEFKAQYADTDVVMYDAVSSSAIIQANEACFGQTYVPDYKFDKADVIVSFGADFLGTWISPVEYAAQYASKRKVKDVKNPGLSWHVQVESGMTLTGSNADNRILVRPSEQGAAIAQLYNEVAKLTGGQTVSAPAVNDKASAALAKVAARLVQNKGKSLVVSSSNNKGEQILVNATNNLLENYGQTISFAAASMQRQGIDANVSKLIREMESGQVDALFLMEANPCFDRPDAAAFTAAMSKVGLRVSFNTSMDETTAHCQYAAPTHHYLEAWGDVQPKKGHYSLVQPTIAPLFKTRQAEESLLRWGQSPNLDVNQEQPYYAYLKKNWEEAMFGQQTTFATFQTFWDNVLHDGVFATENAEPEASFGGDVAGAAGQITEPMAGDGLEISFLEAVNMGGGQFADNPWLMEMPDPITRTVWGNYLMIPVEWNGKNQFAALNGLRNKNDKADRADLTVNDISVRCTVVPSFGQMANTVSLNMGYGRAVSGKCGQGVGVDVYPWLNTDSDGNTQYFAAASLSGKTGEDEEFACVQYHHTMGVHSEDEEGNKTNLDEVAIVNLLGIKGYQGSLTDRTIIYQGSAKDVETLAHDIQHDREHAKHLNDATLYPYEEYKEKFYSQGHHWGMYVDLSACIGCGACTVACMAENNVPVVGKREVHRHHEMTWLRIDRYFYGDAESPNVVYQPLMCQHCDNAPCENVCPVNATNHSSEGLNQMAYNRCVGTRYCANNCPYKVRRFNWLDYTTADTFPENESYPFEDDKSFYAHNLTRMVLNPDVTVRSRGVIEKCSFCVQRIQEGKLTAKKEMRKLTEFDVKTACQTACPTGAIVFGDMNDKKSYVAQAMESPLSYRVLEEVNTESAVTYAARINNKDESLEA